MLNDKGTITSMSAGRQLWSTLAFCVCLAMSACSTGTDTDPVEANTESDATANTDMSASSDNDATGEAGSDTENNADDNVSDEGADVEQPTDTANSDNDSEEPAIGAGLGAIEFVSSLFIGETAGATGTATEFTGSYYETANPIENALVWRQADALDACEVSVLQTTINSDFLNQPVDHLLETEGDGVLQVAAVDAGETIELFSGEGSFLSLTADDTQSGDIVYTSGITDSSSLIPPSELSVAVPGAVYPTVQFQWIKPPSLSADLKQALVNVAETPELQWEPLTQGINRQSRVYLYAGHLNELNGEFTSYQCELSDDGAYVLPASVQTLYENGFVANFTTVGRRIVDQFQVDTTVNLVVYLDVK